MNLPILGRLPFAASLANCPIEGNSLAGGYAGRPRCAVVRQSVRVAQQAAAAHPVIALYGFASPS